MANNTTKLNLLVLTPGTCILYDQKLDFHGEYNQTGISFPQVKLSLLTKNENNLYYRYHRERLGYKS